MATWVLSVAFRSSAEDSNSSFAVSIPDASEAFRNNSLYSLARLPEVFRHARILGALAGKKKTGFHVPQK